MSYNSIFTYPCIALQSRDTYQLRSHPYIHAHRQYIHPYRQTASSPPPVAARGFRRGCLACHFFNKNGRLPGNGGADRVQVIPCHSWTVDGRKRREPIFNVVSSGLKTAHAEIQANIGYWGSSIPIHIHRLVHAPPNIPYQTCLDIYMIY